MQCRNFDGEQTGLNTRRMLAGELLPDAGSIAWLPTVRCGYLRQHSELQPGTTILQCLQGAFASLYETERSMMDIAEKLSQRTEDMDILLLDEPTNYLDVAHIEWLIAYMKRYENAYVVVSHDERFLNVLVLDEPTNHLDVPAKEALAKALASYKGTILLVSHEPEFYEEWITAVWRVEDWK